MKTLQSKNIAVIIAFFVACFCNYAVSQMTHAQQDSVMMITVADDTVQLRQVTVGHSGERTAAQAFNRIGKVLFKGRNNVDAEQAFLQTYQQYLNTPEALEATGYLGRINYVGDHFEKAKSYYKEYLSKNPTGADAQWAQYCLVRSMRQTNDSNFVDAARSYLASSHDTTKSKDVLIEYDLVRYLAYRQQYAQAIAEAETLINRYPTTPYVGFVEPRIADYYLMSGDSTSAINQCNYLLAKYSANTPQSAQAQYILAGIYNAIRNYDQSRSEFYKVSELNPAQTDWINVSEYGLALVDLQQGFVQKDTTLLASALSKLTGFVQDHPTNHNVPQAYMNIANLYTQNSAFDSALAAYNRTLSFDSTLIDTGKYTSHSDEMKAFRDLLLRTHVSKAMLLKNQLHDSQGALDEIDLILASHPDRTDLLLNKALCLVDLSRKDDARTILQQLVSNQTDVKETAARILGTL